MLRSIDINQYRTNLVDTQLKFVYGFSDSKRNIDIWNKILVGDYIFFIYNTAIYLAKVINKLQDKEIAQFIWKEYTSYGKNLNLLIMFRNVIQISINIAEFLKIFGLGSSETCLEKFCIMFEWDQFLKLRNYDTVIKVLKHYTIQSQLDNKNNKSDDITNIIDYEEPPDKIKSFVSRFIRDTEKTLLLKQKYMHKCQICGFRLKVTNNKYYSEVHHIWPLNEGGLDNFDNMIVLCPNHHAAFDLAVIGIDTEDGKSIINKNFTKCRKLFFTADHKLEKSNLKYQIKRMKYNEFEEITNKI